MKKIVLISVLIAVMSLYSCSSVKDNAGSAPVISLYPGDITVQKGRVVLFYAKVSGVPAPVIRWERSYDGNNWSAIVGASEETYSFVTGVEDSSVFFRARAINPAGEMISESASLTIVSTPETKQVIQYGLKY